MILRRLGLIYKNQRGFTLIELIIAIAITGIVTGGITITMFQIFSGNARASNHMTAVRQVQNAGYWLSRDTQMAQNVAPDSGVSGFPLTLIWTDWDGDEYRVVYTLLADELQREHYTNYDPVTNPDPDVTTIVAQYINSDPTKTKCELAAGELVVTVTASVGSGSQERSEARVYRIIPRPGS